MPRKLRCAFIGAPDQTRGIDRCTHLGVIFEIDEDIARGAAARVLCTCPAAIDDFPALRPLDNSTGPCIKCFRTVAAGIEFLVAMKSAVNEIRGDNHEARPINGVGDNRSDALLAQERDELL